MVVPLHSQPEHPLLATCLLAHRILPRCRIQEFLVAYTDRTKVWPHTSLDHLDVCTSHRNLRERSLLWKFPNKHRAVGLALSLFLRSIITSSPAVPPHRASHEFFLHACECAYVQARCVHRCTYARAIVARLFANDALRFSGSSANVWSGSHLARRKEYCIDVVGAVDMANPIFAAEQGRAKRSVLYVVHVDCIVCGCSHQYVLDSMKVYRIDFASRLLHDGHVLSAIAHKKSFSKIGRVLNHMRSTWKERKGRGRNHE